VIIGISGKAGVGKDTATDLLVERFGFVKVALADPLKRICKEVFAFTDEQLWGSSEKRNAPDERYLNELTPRLALQKLGTEWGRECYENVWIDHALRAARDIKAGWGYDPKQGVITVAGIRGGGVVIPDVTLSERS
jgi:hypothetical protein